MLDFPTWTLNQRTSYINGQNGASDKNIKISTIGKACKFLKFSVHKTRYSPPARNSIGLRALRICWSKYVSQIIQNRSSCFVFIDEAGLSFVPRNSMCRGFVGITPLTLRDLQFARISIVAAVIPGYGVIYQWSNGKSVKGPQYCSFLKQVANIVRRFIGNGKTHINLIHDNASIHWTNDVKEVINNERFDPEESRFNHAFNISNWKISKKLITSGFLDLNNPKCLVLEKSVKNNDIEIFNRTYTIFSLHNSIF